MLFVAFDSVAQCTISGLNSNYCTNSAASTLTPGIIGGTFTGPGISGAVFSPSLAGPGTHTINYSICSTSYAITNPSFAPQPTVGTTLASTDFSGTYDDGLATIPIGFNFQFFCTTYTTMYVSTNGFVTFSYNAGANGCCNGGLMPTTGVTPDNMIAAAWVDLYPPGGGSITHTVLGIVRPWLLSRLFRLPRWHQAAIHRSTS